ncbi:unnamed protein product, partial [marine sediment metagenome]
DDSEGRIKGNEKIKASLPTLHYLMSQGATVVLTTHNGRPDGKFKRKLSHEYLWKRIEELYLEEYGEPVNVNFIKGSITESGIDSDSVKKEIQEGAINLLENVRFYEGEETEEEAKADEFAQKLASLVDNEVYIFDAFGSAARGVASGEPYVSSGRMAKYFKQVGMGFLMEEEISQLQRAKDVLYGLILGGGPKLADKLPDIKGIVRNIEQGGFVIIG